MKVNKIKKLALNKISIANLDNYDTGKVGLQLIRGGLEQSMDPNNTCDTCESCDTCTYSIVFSACPTKVRQCG